MVMDLSQGNPWKILLKFSVPMLIGTLFQQFYNIVDTIVVGNFIGPDALAAVGTSGTIMYMINCLGLGLAAGSSVVISQYLGAGQYQNTKTAINTANRMFIVLGILGTVIGLLIIKPMLTLLNTPEGMFGYAVNYLTVAFCGIIFIMMYNVLNLIAVALGDSKTPMFMLLIASVINIILGLLFTVVFGWGTRGVALATVISQGFAATSCYCIIKHHMKNLPSDLESSGFDKKMAGTMLKLGFPAMIQNVVTSSGALAVQGLMNSFGSTTVAAFTAANKIDGIAMAPMVSLGTALGTYTAQNLGAKKQDRVKQGLRFANEFALGTCIVLGMIIYGAGASLMGIFMEAGTGGEVIRIGVEYLHIAVFSYGVMAFMFSCTGLLRGAGDVKTVFICAMLDLGGRVLFAYAMVGILGRFALWLSYPFGWLCSCALAYPRYLSGRWKNIKIIETD